MISAKVFLDRAREMGLSMYSGVPCSLLDPLINCIIERDNITYVGAASEGEAVAIASGAYLAGRTAAVVCQNSGLGNAVNPLTSLNAVFKIPVLLVVTLRGEPGRKDAPQHALMGQITEELLAALRVPCQCFPAVEGDVTPKLEHAVRVMKDSALPYAFILKKGMIRPHQGNNHAPRRNGNGTLSLPELPLRAVMTRREAIEVLASVREEGDLCVSTTGKISRELCCVNDSPRNFYMLGSMGCAGAIALGVSLSRPDVRVLAIDGDGSALMKLGTMATVGRYRPKRFVHVILDNESYESTGGQASSSPCVAFDRVAAACGYASAVSVCSPDRLASELKWARGALGPQLLHVKVKRESTQDLPRPALTPVELKDRFMAAIAAEEA